MRHRRAHDPALTEPHISTNFGGAVVRELDAAHGRALVDDALAAAGLDREYLADPSRWTSVRFMARLCDEIARRVHGVDTPLPYDHPVWQTWRRAAWRVADEIAGNLVWLMMWSMQSPAAYFAAIERAYRASNAINRTRLVAQGEGWSTVEVEELWAHEGRPAACWSRIGTFEKIPEVWGLPRGRVEHTLCRYQDPKIARCVYTVRYDESPRPDPAVQLADLAARMRTSVPEMIASQERHFREHRVALLTQRKVAHYLPALALQRLEDNPEDELALGGRRCEGAVLFADIEGFTRRCVHTAPEAVVEHLNIYFEHMDAAVAEHGGIVDKRMGDGMMVVFVAVDRPVTRAALAAAAIRCGLAMLRRLPRCNAEIAARGGEPLAIRVGVAAGWLVHGNIGSPERMEYTVIGEPVNLASRLQSAATTNHLLTLPECLADLPRLAAGATPRAVTLRGLGEVMARELDPAQDP